MSDREKELVGDASGAFTKDDYLGCLNWLEKLEVRPDRLSSQCNQGPQSLRFTEDPPFYGGFGKSFRICLRKTEDLCSDS